MISMEDCGDQMVIRGKMGLSVWWDYSITMAEEGVIDILHVAAQAGTTPRLV